MRQLIAALVTAVSLAGFAVSTATAASATDTAASATATSASAVLRYVTVLHCRFGGGVVVVNILSPTGYSCRGGFFNGFWVLR
jgi:hypothetical protein